ncbi:MAG: glutamate synthase, partial [Candidatus Bathyarchaeia archaeon]
MAHEGLAGKNACGIFGVLRLEASPKIHSGTVLTAIESVRYRGSNLGAGFAAFDTSAQLDGGFAMKIFVDGPQTMDEVRRFLREAGKDVSIRKESQLDSPPDRRFAAWSLALSAGGPDAVFELANKINERWWSNGDMKARVFSLGRYLNVYKEVGYPADVARLSGFDGRPIAGDLWLAHTRQPTNSPGRYPVWSHPFASFDCAIVHNGDISSYGANMRFLTGRNARSFVGTDSEVIAFLLDHLIRVKRLSILEAAEVLINPYEHKTPDRGDEGEDRRFQKLMLNLRGAQLDGPFTVVAGYADGNDVYLLSLIDRSRFRPIIVGRDEHNIYVASEEAEIRAISPHATVWTPQPGSIVLASMKKGFIQTGRDMNIDSFDYSASLESIVEPDATLNMLDASSLGHSQLNDRILNAFQRGAQEVRVKNVNGHRCLGVNMPAGRRLIVYGTPGNCLANYNEGAEIIVYGN